MSGKIVNNRMTEEQLELVCLLKWHFPHWGSNTEIGRRAGISPNRMWRIMNELGEMWLSEYLKLSRLVEKMEAIL